MGIPKSSALSNPMMAPLLGYGLFNLGAHKDPLTLSEGFSSLENLRGNKLACGQL